MRELTRYNTVAPPCCIRKFKPKHLSLPVRQAALSVG
jgi:hypothetical protein